MNLCFWADEHTMKYIPIVSGAMATSQLSGAGASKGGSVLRLGPAIAEKKNQNQNLEGKMYHLPHSDWTFVAWLPVWNLDFKNVLNGKAILTLNWWVPAWPWPCIEYVSINVPLLPPHRSFRCLYWCCCLLFLQLTRQVPSFIFTNQVIQTHKWIFRITHGDRQKHKQTDLQRGGQIRQTETNSHTERATERQTSNLTLT